jgi:hypothetical protein
MKASSMLERPSQEGVWAVPLAPGSLRAAYLLSGLIVGLMVVASVAGLFVSGLYPDGAWAREALKGGDLATLVLAAPLLLGALILSARGSRRAKVAWVAMLGYSIYNYAYYVFGAELNDVFLLHIAIMSMSIFALALLAPRLDVAGIAARIREGAAAEWIGAFLVLVGLGQGGLWAFLIVRFALTGELLRRHPGGPPAPGLRPRPGAARADPGTRRDPPVPEDGGRAADGGRGLPVRRRFPGQPDAGRGAPGERGGRRREGVPARGHRPDPRVRARLGRATPEERVSRVGFCKPVGSRGKRRGILWTLAKSP